MKKRVMASVFFLVLFLFSAHTGDVWSQDVSSDGITYPIMQPDRETLERWAKEYKNAPEAFIDQSIKERLQVQTVAAGTSLNLLDYIQYTPDERNQGSCGNCWVWSGTGIVEIALGVNNGVKNRLSTQYLNSCKTDSHACCGGTLTDFRDWYSGMGHFIPWSNTNASFLDGNMAAGQCGPSAISCGSITTVPDYTVTSLSAAQRIVTTNVGQPTAIANIKNVLNQKKGIQLSFFLPNSTDWAAFYNFWNYQPESTLWTPDAYCGHTWDSTGGGHGVLIVGYNDEDPNPANHYWIALNSWGTANGMRPHGLYHIPMQMNYDCADINYPDIPNYRFETLDVSLVGNVSPAEGTIGTNFTITGSGFGTQKSFVYVVYERQGVLKQMKPKVTSWTDTSITGIWSNTISAGSYKMYVKPKAPGTTPIYVGYFTVKNPTIDSINPDSCSIGQQNTISGKFFSSKKPRVYLQNKSTLKKYSCKVSGSTMNPDTGDSSLQFSVPKVTDLASGDYILLLQNNIGYATADFCGMKNLSPYKPGSWSDKIVVSKVAGSNTDSSPLYTTDTLYLDWAVINDGTAPTSEGFSVDLYLDGTKIHSWYANPPLDPGDYGYVDDYSLGSLSAGTHTLRIVADSTYAINESNEYDNECTKTITVINPGLQNLSPYKPGSWSDKIVVSKVTGSNTDSSPLYTTDTLYLDWAVINSGTAATSGVFYIDLYLDGTKIKTWYANPPLNPGDYGYVNDYSLGSLSAGTHTLRIVVDSTNTINESNESDNEYTKTITVISSAPPPPQGWTLQIVNNYSRSITQLYISLSTSSYWGANQLSSSIQPGSSWSMSGIPAGTYDLRAVASDGADVERRGLTAVSGETWIWTLN